MRAHRLVQVAEFHNWWSRGPRADASLVSSSVVIVKEDKAKGAQLSRVFVRVLFVECFEISNLHFLYMSRNLWILRVTIKGPRAMKG